MKRGFILFFVLACFLKVTGQSTGKYQIKFLEVNKKNSDYGVAILDENKLIFTSADHKVTTARKNYNPRKDLYSGDIDFDGEIKNVERVTKEINKRVNQTGVTYTKDRKTVYFSRNKYKRKLKKQKLEKNQRLILYKADVAADGSWKRIKKLPFNKKKTSSGYPVLSADDSKLYFVSDRLPSKGKSDIFVVDILKEGNYSKPRNLGSFVNTDGNETTPFITEDNILYFSSDGHEGEGKLDVFAVEVYENGTSEPYHLASPINSINDDFAYIVNKDNNQGFFTSNRLQGDGFNDLYSFTLKEDVRPSDCFITVDGKVRDKESYKALAGATVDLYSIDGKLLESVDTYSDGTYHFTVSCAKEYQLIASNPNYLDDKKRIEILEENYHSALHTNMNLSRIEKKPVIDKLSPIYYEFDAYNITPDAAEEMDRIAEVMLENENLIIEASSFTDSRGTDAYNMELSKRRARAAVEYLKSKGIDESRIRSKGYGEDKLMNQCVNGIDCTDESHQMNRRTEFNFVKIPADKKKKPSSAKTKVAFQSKKSVRPIEVKAESLQKVDTESKVTLSEVSVKPVKKEVEVTSVAAVEEVRSPEKEQPVLEKSSPIKGTKSESLVVAETKNTIVAPEMDAKKMAKPEPVVAMVKEEAIESEEITSVPEEEITEETAQVKDARAVAPAIASVDKIKNDKPTGKNKNESGKIDKETLAVSSEKEKEQTNENAIKEAVVINYNSSIVATNPESNKVLNYIGTEKVKMIEQLSDLEKKYDEAIPKYPKLSDSLRVQKDKIREIITNAENLEETGWSDIIAYKNNVLHFKRKFRDLMVQNSRNRVSGTTSRIERQLARAPEKTELNTVAQVEKPKAKIAEMEETLSVDDIQITAMKKNGKGKYQKTSSANKTDLIKVSFKLRSNEKVDSGRKEAHLVLQNPEGKVEEAKGIFTVKNTEKQSKYTDHAIINYNNHDVDVTMFIQRKGENFEKGVYPIKVFLEGELMAVTKLDLQNPY
ncbi:OmpA family protein [Lutimonas saemankumensis]|uniref:OmpA family protein n=1 Tax=Lutimonas saemankumensis TaxID=483016 RepID=UPI001CD36278|nr:OmpA family protein [Lutimonas saemankumensis]MCA0932945.1 OmpA family protein [Lutimonas saemankumensis]